MIAKNMDDFRYERKFVIQNTSYYDVEMLIKQIPLMFQEIFYQRYVNSLYFDNNHLSSYFENIEGYEERSKTRLRWYGELREKVEPRLEFKIKKNSLNKKEIYQLNPIEHLPDQPRMVKEKVLQVATEIPLPVIEKLIILQPVLITRYLRKYFLSWDKSFRITIDSQLCYYHLTGTKWLYRKMYFPMQTILEIKYLKDCEQRISHITNYIPFRMTKFSKYVMGLNSFFNKNE